IASPSRNLCSLRTHNHGILLCMLASRLPYSPLVCGWSASQRKHLTRLVTSTSGQEGLTCNHHWSATRSCSLLEHERLCCSTRASSPRLYRRRTLQMPGVCRIPLG